ncbi:5734_t:CDS:2 [Entrophospora sp. SA101]|nr:5734_t:CDS:2 [Entrophospora sp. SA101]
MIPDNKLTGILGKSVSSKKCSLNFEEFWFILQKASENSTHLSYNGFITGLADDMENCIKKQLMAPSMALGLGIVLESIDQSEIESDKKEINITLQKKA